MSTDTNSPAKSLPAAVILWLRFVAVLYFLFALMNVTMGLNIGEHSETLTWVVLGALMLYFSRKPLGVKTVVLTVALLELFVWIPGTIALIIAGMSVSFGSVFILLHLVIGAAGLWFMRQE